MRLLKVPGGSHKKKITSTNIFGVSKIDWNFTVSMKKTERIRKCIFDVFDNLHKK